VQVSVYATADVRIPPASRGFVALTFLVKKQRVSGVTVL
jgi:hypothetical protein